MVTGKITRGTTFARAGRPVGTPSAKTSTRVCSKTGMTKGLSLLW